MQQFALLGRDIRREEGMPMEGAEQFEALVDRYEHTLFRAALAILGDAAEAEDAVQDAFLRLLEKRPVFRDQRHERAWLLKVTANGCKSRLRARKRHPMEELLDTYPARDEDSRELLEAVLSLPPSQRAAVHLHYYEGYTTDEIAHILGQRPGTVRSQLSRARAALRQQLEVEF
jgi:RNA polymerase sigma-70 factor (ECF subfamily)